MIDLINAIKQLDDTEYVSKLNLALKSYNEGYNAGTTLPTNFIPDGPWVCNCDLPGCKEKSKIIQSNWFKGFETARAQRNKDAAI